MKKIVISILGASILYLYGAITVQYRLFPYPQIWEMKKSIKWDDVSSFNLGKEFKIIDIKSTIDESLQKSIIYTSTIKGKPLIVSLHTWSGDYTQKDFLAEFAKKNNLNYIHPNFRGPNRTTSACCSKKAIQDIDDAIQYMIDNHNIDTSNITIVGASGGGYITLCSYFKTKHRIKQFLSWVPITNLEDWYIDSRIRQKKYANDIYACTNSSNNILNLNEVRKRSPIYFNINQNTFDNSKLHIFTGINDGYTGSVPITHSINMYNEILKKDNSDKINLVHNDDIKYMLANKYINKQINEKIGDRDVLYFKNYKNISLTIFDGTHEMIEEHTKKLILSK